jgi:hypothetical protein
LGMPGAISQKKRTEMLQAYCDRRSVQHVARVCSVSPTTALRYKRLDRWDARRKSVSKKAEEKIDDSLAEMQARQVRQARAVQFRVGLEKRGIRLYPDRASTLDQEGSAAGRVHKA